MAEENGNHNELLRRMAEMEIEIANLKARNDELEKTQNNNNNNNHPNNGHTEGVVVSPLVLSPSSIPPGEETILQKQIQTLSATEDDLIAQLHKKDQKIEYLEQNVALYKKKLAQTEELLYELQWDPSQDIAVFHLETRKDIESKQEKKLVQMLEQMRIMEKGLRDKQQVIDDLRGVTSYEEQLEAAQNNNVSMSPSLKSVVIDDVRTSNGLRTSQSLRRRNSHSQSSASPAVTPSWLSYIPFFGERSPTAKNTSL